MSLVTNVVRRGPFYYFRTRVPERFRAVLSRQEMWRSLRTTKRSTARRRAAVAALLTESLWHDLERAMSSSRSLPDPAQIKALIDRWLKAELDEDAYIRSMPHPMIHAGVILKRCGEGSADTVIRYLDDDEAAEFESLSAKEQSERIGRDGYYLSQVDDQTLRKAAHKQMFEGAERRHRSEDGSVAEKHVADLFRRENIEVDPDPPPFRWTPMLAFRSWRGVSDECSTPGVSGIVQAGGR